MNEERMAKAWELAAEICSRYDCSELNPPRSDEDLEDLDSIIGEMRLQAERLRAESALLEGVHGNLISPNAQISGLDGNDPANLANSKQEGAAHSGAQEGAGYE